jgi:hypothetical protein
MAFGNYKSVQEVAIAFQIRLDVGPFLHPIPFAIDPLFQEELNFSLLNVPVRASEAAICESLIYPVVKQAWKAYSSVLVIWSHVPFGTEEPLTGTPDYFVSRRSPLGLVQEPPYVLLIEAKKDDFDAGWGQCLAAMLAAQKMNDDPGQVIFGCVSNGSLWQFGQLEGKHFTREMREFVLTDLAGLLAAWNGVFAHVKQQANSPALATV